MKEREHNLDFLRILASFMVVFLHVSARSWSKVPLQSYEWYVLNLCDSFVRCAVPIFFMMSGKLFLSKDTLSIRKLYLKNILHLLVAYYAWSFLYAIDQIGLYALVNQFSLSVFLKAVINSKYHLWYLPSQISVYLLAPIFWELKDNDRILKYFCAVWLAFAVFSRSILLFSLPQTLVDLIKTITFPLVNYCGYFVLGYLLAKNKERIKVRRSGLIVVFCCMAILNAWLVNQKSLQTGSADKTFFNNFSVYTCIAAASLYLLFLNMNLETIGDYVKRYAGIISRYTFFVYLLHVFVLEHLDLNYGISALSFNPLLSVPALSLLIFVLCLIAAYIIDKIPFIRKILL